MSRIESFTRMFEPDTAHGAVITRVEIPLIQRDYAQGRRGEKIDDIRARFLEYLREALAGSAPKPASLDFVYGELKADGTLQPLDGQQRLTTLFLLHWYLAARTGQLGDDLGWTRFTYETRPSARRFCQRLVASTPPLGASRLSEWVQDQPWYLFVWRYDPTINSMLVMLDAIDETFADVDAGLAWQRLTDPDEPAISFHLLPLPDMGSAEDLYVKMNSRGKPLTDFENFKARFEKVIEWSDKSAEFALRADTVWSDVLWAYRGDDDLVDDEFLRYFDFVTEVCEWRGDLTPGGAGEMTRLQRATNVYGANNPSAADNLSFLFAAFDVWQGRDVDETFAKLFAEPAAAAGAGGLPLFFRDPEINLFHAACRRYGDTAGGGNRLFTFGQTLLLYAVVLSLADAPDDHEHEFPGRLRTLRNLVEGSQYEMRAERMPRLLADSRALVLHGELPEAGNTFAVAQIEDEQDKRAFLETHPALATEIHRLEDHALLKGSTTAFELDAEALPARVAVFEQLMGDPSLWWDLTGALLTFGDYQWPRQRNGTLDDSESFQFGTWDAKYSDTWREVLVGRSRPQASGTCAVLADLLDAVASSDTPLPVTLEQLQATWLQAREESSSFDWRYYVVKYRHMREGASGLYYAHGRTMGFSLTNLPGGKKYRNAYFHDPYLLTIYHELGAPDTVVRPSFSGYEWDPRWMLLSASRTGVRCVPAGFELLAPPAGGQNHVFAPAAFDLGAVAIGEDESRVLVTVPKASSEVTGPDAEDRIQHGSDIIRALIDAGL
ncbi:MULTISPECIES: DUF262 domain-containing protein [unclassified Nocardioides]|uniref:DUF262 domain-containing protein n=1 Tax=unclassified Nocardioides TaxID=2615069 RepID=UPI0007030F2F|nr:MULTISPECIES: DUF262 domain-containing protein [unclassified Nocardioides]KRC48804.1 hypothetical protein ASE19_17945 [Nocardioides sp. Root79]KRC75203.1 hypothetical protein ASE20_19845 [Nocardioides sp. Root240]